MAIIRWSGNDSGNEGKLNTAANYIPSGVPGAGDTLVIPASSHAILADEDLSAVHMAALYVDWGSPDAGSIGHAVKFQTDRAVFGRSQISTGLVTALSTCQNISFGSTKTIIQVLGTGQGSNLSSLAPLVINTNHADSIIDVTGTSYVGVGTDPVGATGQCSKLVHSGAGRVTVGLNFTIDTTITNIGLGDILLHGTVSSVLLVKNGSVLAFGDLSAAIVGIYDGAILYGNQKAGSPDIANVNFWGVAPVLDFTQNGGDVVITDATANAGSSGIIKVLTPTQVTFTNPPTYFPKCSLNFT